MNNETKTIKVTIFGSEYTLKAEAENGEIYKIAEYVDKKMREIHAFRPNRPLHQVAILAALNIAEELFQQRQRGAEMDTDFMERLIKLSEKLELGIEKASEDDEPLRE